jgi:hypothetical protein
MEDALRYMISLGCWIGVEGVVYKEFLWIAERAIRAERSGG